jgi:uncharacterized protein (TIGR03437 family)
MIGARITAAIFLLGACGYGATLGRSIALAGGATDLALDERRGRVYLPSGVLNQIQIYNIQRQGFETAIPTDATPLGVAISRDGKFLYAACFDGSLLDVIDLDSLLLVNRIGLPARPQGVAVAADGSVLITTTGSGAGGLTNSLLLYDPNPNAAVVLLAIPVTPLAPAVPVFPPPSGRAFLSKRSQLAASRSGAFIAGVNVPAAGVPAVFVYEAASRTVLRSRAIAGASTTLAISDDGARVSSGAILLDGATLQVLAQHNPANVNYPIDPRSALNVQTAQGGAAFSPDGQTLYSAFNIAPVQTPPAAAGISQMMLNDPDNLLVRMGIQLPDNLAGRAVLSADGANLYALSDSGLAIIPVGSISRSPLAVPQSSVVLLTRDACGVNNSSFTLNVTNPGSGRSTVSSQLVQFAGLAGQSNPATAPAVRPVPSATSTQLVFTYSGSAAARGTGTIVPAHDFAVQSPEAINIPDRVRVFENSRDSDSRGVVIPIATGSIANPLPDLVYDQQRQRVYIANSGMNRVEVYDIRQQRLLAPIKVGQLPVSLALTPDGLTLYVANSGSEVLSIVDPDRMLTVGRVNFPPVPFNSNVAPISPAAIAWGSAGLQVLTSTGALWRVVGDTATLRPVSRVLQTPQGAALAIPGSTMASAPGGEYILVLAPSGVGYLYDASVDDFVASRQIFTPATQTGYFGPVAVGPRGQYFVVNGAVLNQALAPTGARVPAGLISAVAQVSNTSYAIFSPPPAAAGTAVQTASPTVQILDATTGIPQRQVNALEGPLTTVAAAARAAVSGRTMAVDAAGAFAYAVTASGLSVVPLTPVSPADRPAPNQRGAVNLASYQTAVATNGLLSIFGQNLGDNAVASATPLPVILGGTCVTLNNVALPLFMVSPQQINAQIPPEIAAGNFPLVVRSVAKQAASVSQQLAVSRVAPAVLVDTITGQVALFHDDGEAVTRDYPAHRDRPITLYAVGLGPVTGGRITGGQPSPASPLAEVAGVRVFFGDPGYKQSEVIVDWAGLTPGYIGLYQINLRVPGFHEKGEALPVTIRVGSVDSPTSGPVVPYVAVE